MSLKKQKIRLQKRWFQRVWIYIVGLLVLLSAALAIQFSIDNQRAYARLADFPVHEINTEFGMLSYLDEGSGEAILISHGIFGGYDQASVTLESIFGDDYRKISPSRFGYPGSASPQEPTPKNQAKAFLDLLNQLSIQKAYILTASAGGAAGIQFAIQYPERVKGLILLSSGVPGEKKTREEITGLMGPPEPILHDFPMWLSTKYFGFVFKSMFASDIDNTIYKTMLPVSPRLKGILADENITNIDMNINYDDYPVEAITAPILVVHAKDDPMVKFADTQKFIARTHPETAIFDTGGHLITGNGDAVSIKINEFINETKDNIR